MTCKRCVKRGKPTNFGSDPKCAFESGIFSKNNWQCATISELRIFADDFGYTSRQNDESIGVLKIPERVGNGYLVMTWYKNRGAIGGALILDDEEPPKMLTLETAEEIIECYEVTK